MTRVFVCCCMAATLCNPVLAAAQSAAAPVAPAAEVNSNPVVVDVAVTDAQHHPIHNLQASDFIVLEDSHPQTISAFEEHHTWEAAAPMPISPSLPTGAFSNFTIAPVHGTLNIVLLDLLNSPVAARAELRNSMVRYLQQVHPGTHMAVLGLTNRLVLLQGFNSDPQLLSSVLTEKDEPATTPAATGNADSSAASGDDDKSTDAPRTSLGNNPSAAQVRAGLQQFLAEVPTLSFQLRAQATLDAINQLVRSFGRLPGRKNLIWVSGGFPINLQPDGAQPTPFAAVASSADEFRQTASMLSDSQVSVYPIDGGNHTVAPAASGSDSNAKYIRAPVSHTGNPADLYQLTAEEPGTMQAMAEATGGERIALTDDLKYAIEKAIDRGANYYALTYAPTDEAGIGAYRTIDVKLAKPGFAVAYRRAYFTGGAMPGPLAVEPQPNAKVQATYTPLTAAMDLAAPVPTQIIVVATVASMSGDQAKSPFRRYSIQLGVDAKDITCPVQPEGAHQCTLDLSIAAYDAGGAALHLTDGAIQANIAANQFADTLKPGLSFSQDIAIPLASAAFLRIGIRDHATDKVGVVEVPLVGLSSLPAPTPVGSLQPVPAQPVTAQPVPPQPSTGSADDPHPPHAPEP